MIKKVAVMGGGSLGQALTADLKLKGLEVNLCNSRVSERFKPVLERKELDLLETRKDMDGVRTTVKIDKVTTDFADAIKGVDYIMLTTTAEAHRLYSESMIPYLEDGQMVIFNPDNFATLVFKEMLRKRDVQKDIKIVGTESLLYACRKMAPAKVNIFGVKSTMPVAALPVTDTGSIVESLKELFSQFAPAKNVLEISFGNMNMIIHCPTVVLNAGRIENTKGDFMFYWQGMTESVCRVMEKMDKERVGVGERLGLKMLSTHDTLVKFYRTEKAGDDLHDFLTHTRVHGGRGPDAPGDLHHRYLSEDVPQGLVPVSSFGKLVGVPTPAIDSIILLASMMNRTDYFKEGRTIEGMGLSGQSVKEILEYCEG